MKPRRGKFLTGAAGVLASAAVPRFQAGAAEFSYKLGVDVAPTHRIVVRSNEAAAKILEETGGRLEIKVFPASVLGNDTSMFAQLRSGALELQNLNDSVIANVVPAAGIDSVVFAFNGFAQAWSAIDGPLGDYIRAAVAKVGLYQFQKTWDGGFKQIATTTRPVVEPGDLKGLRLRVTPSPILIAALRAFGASPVSMNFAEVYTALQTHIVDGAEQSLESLETAKLYEVTKYVAVTNDNWIASSLVANGDAWQRLPKNLRDVAEKNFDEAAVRERADIAQAQETLPARLQAHGMVFSKPNFIAFQDATRKAGLYAQWRAAFGADVWNLLEKATGRHLA